MRDYCKAHFKASTDFRVGEAICYLRQHYRIVLKYKPTGEPKLQERTIIRDLHLSGALLLNDLGGYNYRTAERDEQREIIRRFCDVLVKISK